MKLNVTKKQKTLLVMFFVIMSILLIVVGGYYALRTLYPVNYEDNIKEYSAQYGVDKYLVLAVIDTESGFRTKAQSAAGATGLMQLMPDTASWIAGKLGEEYNPENLTDAKTNIRYGTWYLSFLLQRYGGDVTCACAAYNAGHGSVDTWLSEIPKDGSIDAELIPYKETNNYVKKVATAYEIYKALYPNF